MDFGEIAREIRARAKTSPYIIAIEGTIGSGKSYEGEKLHEALGSDSILITMDLFVCVSRSEWVQLAKKGDIVLRDWYDIDKVKEVLQSVKKKEVVSVSGLYNIQSGCMDERITIDTAGCRYFILEGLFSFDDELDELVDLRVFLDVPREIALERAESRDEAARHLDHEGWLLKKKVYFDGFLPYLEKHRNKADLILDAD